eukprot:6960178-Pyramimonas_sp.AAC.1
MTPSLTSAMLVCALTCKTGARQKSLYILVRIHQCAIRLPGPLAASSLWQQPTAPLQSDLT